MNLKKDINKKIIRLVGETADELGRQAFIVGGYVRDIFLERKSQDIDFVSIGSGIELAEEVAKKLGPKARLSVFATYGTAQVKWRNYELEFVGARRESYSQDSRNPVVEDGTLEDDQKRRDFTINAMAIYVNADKFGELVDPFNGILDLHNKVIRTPLDPDITFSDDPLRMMRAIRFATQLEFEILGDTFDAIKRNRERITIITKERINDELSKIIRSKTPSIGFKLLDKSGLLEIIFPELHALKGVETMEGRGHKDNFYHTLQVVDDISKYSDNEWLRWAALMHDIAKPVTKKYDSSTGWTFHNHNFIGEKMVPRIFKKMKMPMNEKMKYLLPRMKKQGVLYQDVPKVRGEITTHTYEITIIINGSWKESIVKLLMLCYIKGLDTTKEVGDFVVYMIRPQEDSKSNRNVSFNLEYQEEDAYIKIPSLPSYRDLYARIQDDTFSKKEYIQKIVKWLGGDIKNSYIELKQLVNTNMPVVKNSSSTFDEIKNDKLEKIKLYQNESERFWIKELLAIKKDLEKRGKETSKEYTAILEKFKVLYNADFVDTVEMVKVLDRLNTSDKSNTSNNFDFVISKFFYGDAWISQETPTEEEYIKMGYGKLSRLFSHYNKGVGVFPISISEIGCYMNHMCRVEAKCILNIEQVIKRIEQMNNNNKNNKNMIDYCFYLAFPINSNTVNNLITLYPALKNEIIEGLNSLEEVCVIAEAKYGGKYY